jgi:hypothetical protein
VLLKWFVFFNLLFLSSFSFAFQQQGQVKQKHITAVKTSKAPRIDGSLGEAVWKKATSATGFIQNKPLSGKKETYPTEVKILYDGQALYISALMEVGSADSILRELGKRDEIGNTDFFSVMLDTYNDKMNAFSFSVTSAGVQIDSRYSSAEEDVKWDAVWESATKINQKNWTVEMKIPYSAIRFAKADTQNWGVNFKRHIKGNNEDFYWNPVDPALEGIVNQSGRLEGISNIQSPLRLSMTPYFSTYAANYSTKLDQTNKASYSLVGGMDIKYGISESFTLDMALVPDFGQVQSDNQVLNLSPFEVQFEENRPFFLEGTDLFNKGDFFYSRRIGGSPKGHALVEEQLHGNEVMIENPAQSKMLNATKVSGRTKKGLGIGVLNAVTANMYATLRNESGGERKILTQPLSNYNIIVLDQTLKNNSFISFVNTNVLRNGTSYDANLTGAVFKFATKENNYSINGKAALSHRFDTMQAKSNQGYTYTLEAGKISGNFQYTFKHHVESASYNPNDLGILFNNNEISERGTVKYEIFKPFWKLNNFTAKLGSEYSRLHQPNYFQRFEIFGSLNGTLKKGVNIDTWFSIEPLPSYDFFEPRTWGRVYVLPTNYTVGGYYASDERKNFYYDLNLDYRKFREEGRKSVNLRLNIRYRFNDHFSMNFSFNPQNKYNDIGFVKSLQEDIFFGGRNVKIVSQTLSASYIFTKSMSLTFRARHYYSQAHYYRYNLLNEEGFLTGTDYEGNHNTNFNAFNIDMVFSWYFARGSEIRIVWKDASLIKEKELIEGYFNNLRATLYSRQNNNISLKILYYLDAGRLINRYKDEKR